MSLPTIPNITPKISLTRCETINLLLASIALEEIGLSHILNAEGEKIQHFLKKDPCNVEDYIKINASVNKMLRSIVSSQTLLQFKLEEVISIDDEACHEKSDSKDKDKCSQKCEKKCDNQKNNNCKDTNVIPCTCSKCQSKEKEKDKEKEKEKDKNKEKNNKC
ncbi:hypothetical protein [Ureibacillus endophyticus]|uniref:Uncharacterized protein n=1 Tax=Ureibacillus endophyticus TaxID=1978490 RepID=A0A494Z3W5_9BACL|nr:hypothetical protein [Lysinibacillus endophyticus]RKQ17219.1 hypothetical protein D8M03_07990 [Lysinibacillus endophyticus]